MLHNFSQDIRHGLRAFRNQPAFTAVALITLALGIGANTAIFSVVHGVLLRDLPFPKPDRLVGIYETNRRFNFNRGVVNPFNFDRWERRATSFAHLAAVRSVSQTLVGAGEPVRLSGHRVMPAFFDVMGVQPAHGRPFTRDEAERGEQVVLLSHSLWRERFGGDAAVIGRSINLEGRGWRVIGVMPAGFTYPHDARFWVPLSLTAKDRNTSTAWYLGVVARLKDDASVERAQAELSAMATELEAQMPRFRDRGVNVMPLHEDLVARVAGGLKLLQGVVILVLLIACANIANLLLAQASARQREFSIRAAIGAKRGRLVRQLLVESLMLALAGAALGVVLAIAGVRVLLESSPTPLPGGMTAGVSGMSLAFTAIVAIVTALVFGVAPSIIATRTDLVRSLRDGGRGGSASRGAWLRRMLVAVETALAIVLLAGAALLIRSFVNLTAQETGFDHRGVVTAHISLPATSYPDNAARSAFWARLFEALESGPGLRHAAGSSALPFSNWEWQSPLVVQGREHVANDGVSIRTITPGYADVLGIPLIAGRMVSRQDVAGSERVAVVNASFARTHLTGLNPLGQRISLTALDTRQTTGAPEWLEIVGVIGDTRHISLEQEPRPEVYRPLAQSPTWAMTVALRGDAGADAGIAMLKRAVTEIDPHLPLQNVAALDSLVDKTVATRRFHMGLLSLFAGLALVLAACGVYGVMSFSMAQRSREVAIRLALGAQTHRVIRMMLTQGLQPVIIGAGIGVTVALYATRVLESQLFLTSRRDPVTLAAVCGILLSIAALACWMPARRTSRVDPIHALRSE